jgi:hypothetical protein
MPHFHSFLALVAVVVIGCSNDGAPPAPVAEHLPAPSVNGIEARTAESPVTDGDRRAIFDALLYDAVTDPTLKHLRDFYGAPGGKRIALVLNSDGFSWPDWYRPGLDGYEVVRVVEGTNADPASPRLLGFRLDKFNLGEKRNQVLNGQIRIVMLNAGGDSGGATVIGGCDVFYDAKRDGDKWTVESNGALDP